MAFFSRVLEFLNRLSGGRTSATMRRELRPQDFEERFPRIRLVALSNLSCDIDTSHGAIPAQVANISFSGLGLIRPDGVEGWEKGSQIRGKLRFGEHTFSMAAQVVHNTGQVTGCRFSAVPAELKKAIEQYFSAELAALTLTEVNRDILKPDPEGTPRWYRGRGGAELYFVENGDQVLKFHMAFLGFYIHGGLGKGIRLSTVSGDDPTVDVEGDLKYKPSAITVASPGLTKDVAEAALKFLNQVPHLSTLQKQMIRSFIEGAQFT